ncbi:hypothetical protein LIZ87_14145 [Lacrimispora sp. 210928-DFI.3.58]|nr:hypothetical protein [Lacrimispora sp. 210928-DFI.3.58]
MALYMYIKETKYTLPMKEQLSYAKEKKIARERLLGPDQYARENCTNILQLINHPLKAGDQLIIRNLLIIGHTHRKIRNTLDAYHRARIQLIIADINYHDQVPESGDSRSSNSDYAKITAFLKAFELGNERRKLIQMKVTEPSGQRGRPAKNWNTIPQNVREIIIYHMEHLYDYPESRAIMDIKESGYSIGVTSFRAIKKEYKERFLPKSKTIK